MKGKRINKHPRRLLRALLGICLSAFLCLAVFYAVTVGWDSAPESRPLHPAGGAKSRAKAELAEATRRSSVRQSAPLRKRSGQQPRPKVATKQVPKRGRERLVIDRYLSRYETIGEVLNAFGYPADFVLSKEEENNVFSLINEYQEAIKEIDKLQLSIARNIIKEKIKQGNYYDAQVYDELMRDWEWSTSAKVITSTWTDGEQFFVVIFRNEIEKKAKELELEKAALFEDTQAQIDAILSKAMESRAPNPR